MSETKQPKKPKAIYNPGELERTRKNIGEISPEEAMRIANRLGGEVGVEKSPKFDNFVNKSNRVYVKKNSSTENHDGSELKKAASTQKAMAHKEEMKKIMMLPNISGKNKTKFDKLMAGPDYKIKNPPSLLNFILSLGKLPDRVSEEFISITLLNQINHLQKFISCIRQLVLSADENYKLKINEASTSQFKMLKYVTNFDFIPIKDLYSQLSKTPNDITVTRLIPFIKVIYKPLMTLYFLGESRVTAYIKNAYTDMAPTSKIPDDTLLQYAREGASEWIYINGQIIKGLYPLLMRMCSSEFYLYPAFFSVAISKILVFLNMTKYDLILPDNDKKAETIVEIKPKEEKVKEQTEQKDNQATEESEKEKPVEKKERPKTTEIPVIVKQGLDVLERIFPDVGWQSIRNGIDFYPYFQPLYQFEDGFNLLNKTNPMQLTIILIRIIEDFFQGCRHIKFSIDKEPDFTEMGDNLSDVFSEWSYYREAVFNKEYLAEIKDYVNHVSTQSDFKVSPYAKKKMSNMLWQTKYMFLPHLSFELVFMEKPNKDIAYKTLPSRLDYIKAVFGTLISRIESDYSVDMTKSDGNDIYGASNIFDKFHFDIPNVVSKRIEVLLGGKKSKNITNFNLMKYTLCVISVLDWWINSENSPGYELDSGIPYRTDPETGAPVFSVPLRENLNEVFVKSVQNRVKEVTKN